ncbi:MAG TPA: DUF1439 domain-containing protein [Ignavibacteriaceae bacterium]
MEHEVSFTESQIHELLSKPENLEKTYKGLITVVFKETPSVKLGSPTGKATIIAQADIVPLGQPPIPVNATAIAGIRYDEKTKSFYLEDPKVQSVSSPYLQKEYEQPASKAVSKFMTNYFEIKPVYTLKADRNLKESTVRWLLKTIRIESGKVVATLSPF